MLSDEDKTALSFLVKPASEWTKDDYTVIQDLHKKGIRQAIKDYRKELLGE